MPEWSNMTLNGHWPLIDYDNMVLLPCKNLTYFLVWQIALEADFLKSAALIYLTTITVRTLKHLLFPLLFWWLKDFGKSMKVLRSLPKSVWEKIEFEAVSVQVNGSFSYNWSF